MKDHLPKGQQDAIERKAKELQSEFFEHLEEFRAANPAAKDAGPVFQGWVIEELTHIRLRLVELERRGDPSSSGDKS